MELEQSRAMARAQERNMLLLQTLVHHLLVVNIERAGCLVQERVVRTVEQETREGEPLLLTRRKHVGPMHFRVKSAESLGQVRKIHCSQRVMQLFIANAGRSRIRQLIAQRAQYHVRSLRQ